MKIEILRGYTGALAIAVDGTRHGPDAGPWTILATFQVEETEEVERCEACGEPATHQDVEGVPFCESCWVSLTNEAGQ